MRTPTDIAVAFVLVAGVLFAFADPLVAMVNQWNAIPMYSYAYTVPAISLYFLWSVRAQFRRRPLVPARLLGASAILLGLSLLAVGEVGAIQVLQQLAFLIVLCGLVLFLFGVGYFLVSLPALAYLLLMVPLWDILTEPLHAPFQANSAALAVALMQAVGIPAHREGVFIALPNVTLEVARACSGVNYLIAVLALALPLSYLRLHGIWRRGLLIASAMVIAGLANGLRVALIGILAYYNVGSPLHGPFHLLHGLFVACVGYVTLFAGLRLLQSGLPSATSMAPPAAPGLQPVHWHVGEACGLAVLMWTVAVIGIVPVSARVALAAPLDRIPTQLGDWRGETVRVAAADSPTFGWTNADDHLTRRYTSASGQVVTVDVWYFETQQQSREIVNFETGELHRDARPASVRLMGGGMLEANLVHWPERQEVGLFWYDFIGVTEADQNAARLRSLWNGLYARRRNGAAIMLRTASPDGSEEGAAAALSELAAALHPALALHWSMGTVIAGVGPVVGSR